MGFWDVVDAVGGKAVEGIDAVGGFLQSEFDERKQRKASERDLLNEQTLASRQQRELSQKEAERRESVFGEQLQFFDQLRGELDNGGDAARALFGDLSGRAAGQQLSFGANTRGNVNAAQRQAASNVADIQLGALSRANQFEAQRRGQLLSQLGAGLGQASASALQGQLGGAGLAGQLNQQALANLQNQQGLFDMLGPLAGSAIGGYFGGPAGASIGGKLGSSF